MVRESKAKAIEDLQDLYYPSYNVTPTRFQPVLVKRLGEEEERILTMMRWGLPLFKEAYPIINARNDSLLVESEKPVFNRFKNKSRCVVVCNGYMEWDQVRKQPYYFYSKEDLGDRSYMDANLLYIAGLYGRLDETVQGISQGYLLVTTEPYNPDIFKIHGRQPLILEEKDIDIWLDPNTEWTESLNKIAKDPCRHELGFHALARDFPEKVRNLNEKGLRPIVLDEPKTFFRKRKQPDSPDQKQKQEQ